MKISTLKEFLYLAEELNFSETARRFYINQSALSRHIADLESEIGTKLFLRNKQGVRLTKAGKMLVDRARPFGEEHDSILADIKRIQEDANSRLAIGYLQGAAGDLLDAAFKLYRRERPGTSLAARSMQPDQILEKLKANEIDVGITMRVRDAESALFESRILYEDEFALMMRSDNKLGLKGTVSVDEITEPILVPEGFPHASDLNRFLLMQLEKAGVPYVMSGAIDDMESMPLLLSRNQQITISCMHLSRFFGTRFRHVAIEAIDLGFVVCIMWKRSRENPAIVDFADCLAYGAEVLAHARG